MKHMVFTWLMMVILSACAGMPQLDTMNKRVSAMDISYIEVIRTISLRNREGSLTASQKIKIAETLIEFNKVRDIMYLALRANDSGGFDSSIATINTLLLGLRTLLTETNGRLDYGNSKHTNITRYGNYGFDRSIEDTSTNISCSIGKPGRYQRRSSGYTGRSGYRESGVDRFFVRQGRQQA